ISAKAKLLQFAWLGMMAFAASVQAQTVLVCADRAEMPPFTFAQRVNAFPSSQVIGASVDLLQAIARKHGWQLEVQLLPWARCLREVAEDRIQIALNVGQEEARGAGLLLSRAYFSTHTIYAYSRRTHPQGLAIHSMADVSKFHVCGLGGYRFESFGLATASVDRGTTRSYEQLITKLHLGRCDLVIDSRETIAGMYLIDPKLRALLVDGGLGIQALPDAPQRQLFIAVSSKASNASELLKALNEGIAGMEKSREIDRFINAYLAP
ncbi:MAG: transporter substrate-binding domain-containing protein, partial [Burkholderiaceae bacterium]|nr:transporter substrate-binding domain-containing protein [Burkholderiaceae bacterium]